MIALFSWLVSWLEKPRLKNLDWSNRHPISPPTHKFTTERSRTQEAWTKDIQHINVVGNHAKRKHKCWHFSGWVTRSIIETRGYVHLLKYLCPSLNIQTLIRLWTNTPRDHLHTLLGLCFWRSKDCTHTCSTEGRGTYPKTGLTRVLLYKSLGTYSNYFIWIVISISVIGFLYVAVRRE